jgi:hypothetical protein
MTRERAVVRLSRTFLLFWKSRFVHVVMVTHDAGVSFIGGRNNRVMFKERLHQLIEVMHQTYVVQAAAERI